MKSIAEQIKKETLSLEQRGVPSDSFFRLIFTDGSTVDEHTVNWSDVSEAEYVEFSDQHKTVLLCQYPVKELIMSHGGITTTIEVEEGEKVYQSIAATATYASEQTVIQKIIGRRIGKVRDGKVTEERFIDGRTSEVLGMKF